MKKIVIPFIIILLFLSLTAANDEYYFKISKSFDVFGAVFREINDNYVVDIDPEEVVINGIQGMLKELDPYTVYYQEKEKEEIDLVTEGEYVGFGITIRKIDGNVTIVDFAEDFRAYDSGLRIGDIIYKINDSEVMNMNNDELKGYTQGVPGSIANVEVLRNELQDTVKLKVERNSVKIRDVSWFGMINKDVGLIRLERFSKHAVEEFYNALIHLKENNKPKALIIDVRDNPGGLLEAAVGIAELFLPRGSLIVSTKGKRYKRSYDYRAEMDPVDLDIPLAVLIDGGSASASEILAGAIQDHDRGIILGRRSFGKGLVQTIFNLPYKSKLKITTANYYTPSGRSIQKVVYGNNRGSSYEIDTFFTDNGRPVFESKGITPDSTLDARPFNSYINDIAKRELFFKFATRYIEQKGPEGKNFSIDDDILSQFKEFLSENTYYYKSRSIKLIEELYLNSEEDNFSDRSNELLDSLNSNIRQDNKELFDLNRDELKEHLEFEIVRRNINKEELLTIRLPEDETVVQAAEILSNDIYNEILAGEVLEDGRN